MSRFTYRKTRVTALKLDCGHEKLIKSGNVPKYRTRCLECEKEAGLEVLGYSFCESVHATSRSPWHIRPLTKEGIKFGGGVDTPSFCGRVEKRMGWDLNVEISERLLEKQACKECVKEYRRRKESNG